MVVFIRSLMFSEEGHTQFFRHQQEAQPTKAVCVGCKQKLHHVNRPLMNLPSQEWTKDLLFLILVHGQRSSCLRHSHEVVASLCLPKCNIPFPLFHSNRDGGMKIQLGRGVGWKTSTRGGSFYEGLGAYFPRKSSNLGTANANFCLKLGVLKPRPSFAIPVKPIQSPLKHCQTILNQIYCDTEHFAYLFNSLERNNVVLGKTDIYGEEGNNLPKKHCAGG